MLGKAVKIDNLCAAYGQAQVLHGVSLEVGEGEVVALLGRNGAGRTTTLRSIMGLVSKRSGSIRIYGEETIGWQPYRVARKGVGFCPEERGIFSSLTCEENLLLPPRVRGSAAALSLDEIYFLFPNLAERSSTVGTKMSGGEQQMLAIARILRAGARTLLLDEISEGLAPVIVRSLGTLIRDLKKRGYTILMVEQNFRFAQPLADRFYFIENGAVAEMVHKSDLAGRSDALNNYLSV